MADRKLDKFAWLEALRGADLTHAEYRVAVNLCTYARADLTNARPGPATLRIAAGVNEKTLTKALRALVAKGWIRITEQGGSERGGPRRATVYALTFPTGGSQYPGSTDATGGSERPGSDPETGGSDYPGSNGATGGSEFPDRGYSVPRPGVVSTDDRGYSLPPHQCIDQGRTGEDHSRGSVPESAPAPQAVASTSPTPTADSPATPPDTAPEQSTPPPGSCPRHPAGTHEPCGQCAERRRQHETAEREQLAADAERARSAAESAAAARARCPHCDESGCRVQPHRLVSLSLAVTRCDHTAWTEADWDAYAAAESPEARRRAIPDHRPSSGRALLAVERANRRREAQAAMADADKDALCPVCSVPLGTISAKRGVHFDCASRGSAAGQAGRL
ncbi:hypothetical protein ACFYTF_04600 [Nocardia thailandica]|uniref:Helix-turn-helix domain-containing protein n=1 Tax=Nocardia thailandica TaxID=257275 RepID=A0ABW6PI69_9NOCA